MISNQDKQAILKGAYGISRKGYKCKFVGLINGTHSYTYMFVYFNTKGLIFNTEHLNEDFKYHTEFESPEDVVGLWGDKPEPFNLEKALQGSPVLLRNGSKAYVKFRMPENYTGAYPLRGYYQAEWALDGFANAEWTLQGKEYNRENEFEFDIIGMWDEDEPQT